MPTDRRYARYCAIVTVLWVPFGLGCGSIEGDLEINERVHGLKEQIVSTQCSLYASMSSKELKEELKLSTSQNYQSLGYKTAKREIFLEVDNNDNAVQCIYTGKYVKIVNNKLPSENIINIEHAWPQSKLSNSTAKSDIHHLFPSDSRVNSARGNLPFGMVTGPDIDIYGSGDYISKRGESPAGRTVFEPPDVSKGDIARALFYLAVRYKLTISDTEEAFLRDWHFQDVVSDEEMTRNDEISALQRNRNPFVDCPELVERINDF